MREDSSPRVNRRTLLGSMGAAGAITVAGCTDIFGDGDAPLQLRLETNSDSDDRVSMVELIAAELEDTGYFDVEIDTVDFDTLTDRVLQEDYGHNGDIAVIGLSGTFNPESFCNALHHSTNIGACCNTQAIADDTLDEMMDSARYDVEVIDDLEQGSVEERRDRYDEIWEYLAEERYSSIINFSLNTPVLNTDIHGWDDTYPFTEGMFSYALYQPHDEQVIWMDEDHDPEDTDLDDLEEGGELGIGMPVEIETFDPPYSSEAAATLAQNFIYEQLVTSDIDGNIYPWLAEDYELVDINEEIGLDNDVDSYVEYMTEVDLDEDGLPDTSDLDRSEILIFGPADPEANTMQILTPEGAADAVADGTYGMHYRFYLREGIEFHNGDELTAEDVVESYKYYEESDLAPQTFDSVLHARQPDAEEIDGDHDPEYVVDIYAQIPDAEAERELTGVYILPASQIQEARDDGVEWDEGFIDGLADEDSYEYPVGTGPYELDEYEDQEFFDLEKFENYWVEQIGVEEVVENADELHENYPDGPVIDEITCDIVPDDSTRDAALLDDEFDATYGLQTIALQDNYEDSDDYRIVDVISGGYDYLQYPVNVPPWSDPRLRKAVNHLIPRESIVENVFQGYAEEAFTPVPPLAEENGTADADALRASLEPENEYDPEQAEELLEEVVEDLRETTEMEE